MQYNPETIGFSFFNNIQQIFSKWLYVLNTCYTCGLRGQRIDATSPCGT